MLVAEVKEFAALLLQYWVRTWMHERNTRDKLIV
jgi:hypothetical protein